MGMGSSRGNGPRGLVADINVTPLVDVMLVLLIIFMVTAPMMTQGLNVDLPPTTTNELRQKEDSHVVSVDRDGKITFDKIDLGQFDEAQPLLREKLAKIFAEKGEEEIILIKADKNVVYGVVVSIMDDIKTERFKHVGMVTNPPEEKK